MAIQTFSHLGICVSDLDRSRAFYIDQLGYHEVAHLDVEGEEPARLLMLEELELRAVYLERDGMRIELLYYARPGHVATSRPRPMNRLGLTHLSLRVDDLEATLASMRSAGVEILEQTHIANPEYGTAVVMVCDPDGTLVELVQAPGDPKLSPGHASSRDVG